MSALSELKTDGMKQASVAYESLSANTGLTVISIFKAAVATKCGEMIARLSETPSDNVDRMMDIIETFFKDCITIGGEEGIQDRLSHVAALELDKVLPMSEDIYNDPALFATRMHALDGVILLAANQFGKDKDVHDIITKMQQSFMMMMLAAIMQRAKDDVDAN